MPARPLKPERRTVYLDTSTLSDIADVALETSKADHAYAPLVPWLATVAENDNLIVSLAHVNEWAGLRADVGDAFAEWLDRFPLVWGFIGPPLESREADYWLARLRGQAVDPFRPFAPSMLRVIDELSFEDAQRWLRAGPTFQRLVSEWRTSGHTELWRAASLDAAIVFNHDAQWVAEQGWSAERMREELEYKHRVHLRTLAQEALDRAGMGTQRSYQDRFVEMFADDPSSLRGVRVMDRITSDFAKRARNKLDAGSSASQKEFAGTFGDAIHARLGAGYCDVFTCDEATDIALGDVREGLGMRRQLSKPKGARANAAAFVADLLAT